MTEERIDEILGGEEELIPSSGFLASVMERVREEAATPAPIPFPWKRAVPGWIVAAGVFAWGGMEFAHYAAVTVAHLSVSPPQVPAEMDHALQQAGWVTAAVAVSLVSWVLSRRAYR